jgi:beta-phosphoglucomutase
MPLNAQKVKSPHLSQGQNTLRTPPAPAPAQKSADDLFAAWILGTPARVPKRSSRLGLQAVLFDLDGVLVDTAEFHYRAWKRLADDLGIPFDRQLNHAFRGVGRMECLEKLLRQHSRCFVAEEKRLLAERKNTYYLELVHTLTPADLEDGALALATALRTISTHGAASPDPVRLAVVSASRNARLVLNLLAIEDWFDAIIDGSDVTRGKPHPQGFLLAADRLRVLPQHCVVVEDADAGLAAARAAGMACVGVGNGVGPCDLHVQAVGELSLAHLETTLESHRLPA